MTLYMWQQHTNAQERGIWGASAKQICKSFNFQHLVTQLFIQRLKLFSGLINCIILNISRCFPPGTQDFAVQDIAEY